jgi:leucyl-tRNA synthetase
MVLSPEHELVKKITTEEQKEEVEKYVKEAVVKSELERTEAKEKTGVFTGSYAINPVNNKKIPIFIADYVLLSYGTGAIMAVPAHDERDFEFAKKYNLPIKQVVKSSFDFKDEWKDEYSLPGKVINSEFLDGLKTEEAKKKIIEYLKKEGKGDRTINYRLRDWCISRQRYWGPPIPIVHCDMCGPVVVPESGLPVVLPELEKDWEPAGDGRGPLAKVKEFMEVKCPKCGAVAKREADVMDNFLDSAWYFFRYIDPKNQAEIFNKELGKKWLPVDLYVGGNEHAVLHLMYTRFITMFLKDLGLIDFDNPFKRFRANGMILKDGKKMSKSKGNVINPEEYGEKVGYDALKTYILFLGPLSEDRSFSDEGVLGAKRWIEKISRLEEKLMDGFNDNDEVIKNLHKTIKAVSDDFEDQKYNTAVARLMEMTNILSKEKNISKDVWKKFLSLIAPFAPALAEEMWSSAGNKESIFKSKNWPEYNLELARDDMIEMVIQVNGKVREKIEVDAEINEEEIKKIAEKSEAIKKWTDNKEVIKQIFIKGKLLNIVVH